ncbi:NmrA family NAD(P)-binding protein [Actinoplanes hulinensis]|uniref:NmrA family NAD(P)-binding protein n=1 Tax=Actinoplanes hulinensis TaxID=1144547 RepID=A0ABS7B1S1_9ACTN|nr:NmrA family NAD(P)-binding protein [Actinoplanes hulinensis]MBW6434930.1 NmrA family NAD(P)-binding protein [Actinoplanes hulinensis]
MTTDHKAKVLVTGATGMQGGAVAHALLRAGHPVTAFVRDPSSAPAQALAAQGAVLATGDLEDVASLKAASAGHDAVFSVQLAGIDPADPAEIRQAGNIVTAAQSAGITQLLHTSVSATGWRTQHPDIEVTDPVMKEYWNQKEETEDVIRRSGLPRWTIFKPAWYMENFLPPRRDYMAPDLPKGKLVTAMNPQTELALICADDLGAAVAAAVAEPDRFHEAEIEMAGDALTYPQMAEILSQVTGREITIDFISLEEATQRFGTSAAFGDVFNDRVGYPARPHHAAAYGLSTTTFAQWAARQDWSTMTA